MSRANTGSRHRCSFFTHSASSLSPDRSFHTALLLVKGFPSEKIHQSYHVPYHPEAASWVEKWNSLSKTQSQHQLDSSILQNWARFSRKLSVEALNQDPVYDAVSPKTRFMGPRIQGWKWAWHLSPLALVMPQHKVCLLFPQPYAQLTWWCQFQREECFHEETQQ